MRRRRQRSGDRHHGYSELTGFSIAQRRHNAAPHLIGTIQMLLRHNVPDCLQCSLHDTVVTRLTANVPTREFGMFDAVLR